MYDTAKDNTGRDQQLPPVGHVGQRLAVEFDHSHGDHGSRVKANASLLSACRCLR